MNLRSRAFLALLADAANEGFRTGRFDPFVPNRDSTHAPTSVLFDAQRGSIPMRVRIGSWRADEAHIAVAAWPTPDADQWIAAMNAKTLAGDVTAIGYLERRNGRLMLSNPFDPLMFVLQSRMNALKMLPTPDDTADPLQLYPRFLSYAAAVGQ